MTFEKVIYTKEEVLKYHSSKTGKIEITNKTPIEDKKDLSLAYTPGVAEVCKSIANDYEKVFEYTNKGNSIAIVTDGTAILGLGDIGSEAGLPVMEGKSILFKLLAGVDAYPICLNTTDTDQIIETVKNIQPSFGGINLEDIAAPRCFEIEKRLSKELSIPVFHDDQHGTAVVTLAGLLNALKIVGKKIGEIKVVVNGAGAAGIACAKFYMHAGVKDIILTDSIGTIYEGRDGLSGIKEDMSKVTNRRQVTGGLEDAIKGADVFLGLSVGNVVTKEMIQSMSDDPIVFACANPDPEIMPEKALDAGARIVATGRSDYPNQINNVLGFPGIFRGALDTLATEINDDMNLAASLELTRLVKDDELNEEYIIINPLDKKVVPRIAQAVADQAMKSGVARRKVGPREVMEKTEKIIEYTRKKILG